MSGLGMGMGEVLWEWEWSGLGGLERAWEGRGVVWRGVGLGWGEVGGWGWVDRGGCRRGGPG